MLCSWRAGWGPGFRALRSPTGYAEGVGARWRFQGDAVLKEQVPGIPRPPPSPSTQPRGCVPAPGMQPSDAPWVLPDARPQACAGPQGHSGPLLPCAAAPEGAVRATSTGYSAQMGIHKPQDPGPPPGHESGPEREEGLTGAALAGPQKAGAG